MGDRFIKSLLTACTAAVLFALAEWETFAAVLLAVAVHELGHLAAMLVMGINIKGIKIELSGLRIDYTGEISSSMEIVAALAGPLMGLFYSAFICPYFKLSAEISLVYSLFNLLPVFPLDGGRIAQAVAAIAFESPGDLSCLNFVSTLLAIAITAIGLYIMLAGNGAGIFVAGIWLLILQS